MSDNSYQVSNDPSLPVVIGAGVAFITAWALAYLARVTWKPLRQAARWLRGWWLSRHPQHKRLRADAEVVPSLAFRSSFAARAGHETVAWPDTLDSPWGTETGPPWEPQEAPADVADTMVRSLPFGPQPPPQAAAEPVAPGELAPWVKEALGGHDGPDAALDSIVARVVKRDA